VDGRCVIQTWSRPSTATPTTAQTSQWLGSGFGHVASTRKIGTFIADETEACVCGGAFPSAAIATARLIRFAVERIADCVSYPAPIFGANGLQPGAFPCHQ